MTSSTQREHRIVPAPKNARLSEKLQHHIAQRSLTRATIKKIKNKIRSLRHPSYSRYQANSWDEAARALADITLLHSKKNTSPALVVIRPDDPVSTAYIHLLDSAGVSYRSSLLTDVNEWSVEDIGGISSVAVATSQSRDHFVVAQRLMNSELGAQLPLDYVATPAQENSGLLKRDAYRDGDFVSPLLVRYGRLPQDIYEESLTKFELKTDVRDYLDLWQLVESIVNRGIEGNIAEFGSYKGHSGYLISRILTALSSDKQLFMFDTFEAFPDEDIGVDKFWSNTHEVDFEDVSRKFKDIDSVTLAKGDFAETLPTTDTGKLALAYVDCDAYRSTKYLLENLWETRIAKNGIVALEDYGHAALLGNRLAAHEFFDQRGDAVTFFSQFSGFFIAIKTA